MDDNYLWLEQILESDTIDTIKPELIASAVKATLAETEDCFAWGINPVNGGEHVAARIRLLKQVYPEIVNFVYTQLKTSIQAMLPTLWRFWLPLAMDIAQTRHNLGYPVVQGILGGQGTGKTTLTKILNLILPYLGYKSASLSIDDLYLTYEERCQLREKDPRLIWRGPPGTHDIQLGLETISQFRAGHPQLSLPRFDKSLHGGMGDRAIAEVVSNIDILLFEGWFVGVRPIAMSVFKNPPPPICSHSDKIFAIDMNQTLHNYLPLWQQLDKLLVLYPHDYRFSLEWRKQAEREMIAQGKTGMTDNQIEEFVNYFWCALHPELFIKPLLKSNDVDLVIEITADHQFDRIFKP